MRVFNIDLTMTQYCFNNGSILIQYRFNNDSTITQYCFNNDSILIQCRFNNDSIFDSILHQTVALENGKAEFRKFCNMRFMSMFVCLRRLCSKSPHVSTMLF